MADLTKLVFLGAFLVVAGVTAVGNSWRHRGEADPEDPADIGNFLNGAIGVAAIVIGICALAPPVITVVDGGPWL